MSRSALSRLCTVAALAVAMVLGSAAIAFAAPVGEPILGLSDLQSRIDSATVAGTPLMGYMKTVVSGAKIATIPVEVIAITGDSDPLILFEAQGPLIAKYGGIVAGMSGSPVYLTDDGTDKVIGAVSYGDIFTIGGSGLATPIESMLKISTDYAPRVERLDAPVLMDGRVVDKVIVPANPNAYKSQSQAGSAFVAKPLSSVYLGGVNPKSPLFAALKKKIEANGQSVISLGAGLSAGASTFATDLAPGAAVGALYSRGDMWIGALGTVTYADADTLLAFGHSLDWSGPTSMYLTNAWISGVWPSQLEPYKIGYPTMIRGTFTQDRNAGDLGVLDQLPAEVPVTAEATDVGTGRVASSTVYMTSEMVDNGQTSDYLGSAAAVAGFDLYDQYNVPGSALTTTTVVVSDGTDEYTIVIPNMVDDSFDVTSYVYDDVDMAISSLLSVRDDGLQQPHIVSVDLESAITLSTTPAHGRRSARIVDVKPETTLKVGANRVDVSLLAVGVAATQTVDATITIPAGTPVSGMLVASNAYYSEFDPSDYFMTSDGLPFVAASGRETIAQVADDLNATLPNNAVVVSFYPQSNADSSDGSDGPSSATTFSVDTTISIDTTVTAPWVSNGQASTTVTELTAFTSPVSYGWDGMVEGMIFGPSDPVVVSVYGTPVGGVESFIASDTAEVDPDTGDVYYGVYLPEMYTNTTLRVHVDGGADYTAADTYVTQIVSASVRLTSSAKSVKYHKKVTLTAWVVPGLDTGTVTFQYYNSKHKWQTITSRALASGISSSKASYSWAPPKGSTKVRVVYGGCLLNGGATSSIVTVTAK